MLLNSFSTSFNRIFKPGTDASGGAIKTAAGSIKFFFPFAFYELVLPFSTSETFTVHLT
jgi:hypothetical protein